MNISKKLKIVTGIIAFSAVMVAGQAAAFVKCQSGSVIQSGPWTGDLGDYKYMVRASCADTTVWTGEVVFLIPDDTFADGQYAAALTALSTGNMAKMVVSLPADVDHANANVGLMLQMYVNK
jgi:hypothetical protein